MFNNNVLIIKSEFVDKGNRSHTLTVSDWPNNALKLNIYLYFEKRLRPMGFLKSMPAIKIDFLSIYYFTSVYFSSRMERVYRTLYTFTNVHMFHTNKYETLFITIDNSRSLFALNSLYRNFRDATRLDNEYFQLIFRMSSMKTDLR